MLLSSNTPPRIKPYLLTIVIWKNEILISIILDLLFLLSVNCARDPPCMILHSATDKFMFHSSFEFPWSVTSVHSFNLRTKENAVITGEKTENHLNVNSLCSCHHYVNS